MSPCVSDGSFENAPCFGSANHGGICRASDLGFHASRPRTRALVRQERERCNLAGTMTALAVRLQDRQNVPVKRGRGGRRRLSREVRRVRRQRYQSRCAETDDDSPHTPSFFKGHQYIRLCRLTAACQGRLPDSFWHTKRACEPSSRRRWLPAMVRRLLETAPSDRPTHLSRSRCWRGGGVAC